jgi:hypothetical protein
LSESSQGAARSSDENAAKEISFWKCTRGFNTCRYNCRAKGLVSGVL